MSKLNLTLLLLTLFLFANCKTLKRQNVNKNTTGTKITEKTSQAVAHAQLQRLGISHYQIYAFVIPLIGYSTPANV